MQVVRAWMCRRTGGHTGKKTWTWIDNKPVDRLVDGLLLNRQAGEQIDGWTDGFSQMNLIGCTQSHQTLIAQSQAST